MEVIDWDDNNVRRFSRFGLVILIKVDYGEGKIICRRERERN